MEELNHLTAATHNMSTDLQSVVWNIGVFRFSYASCCFYYTLSTKPCQDL